MAEKVEFTLDKVENTVGKGENTGYHNCTKSIYEYRNSGSEKILTAGQTHARTNEHTNTRTNISRSDIFTTMSRSQKTIGRMMVKLNFPEKHIMKLSCQYSRIQTFLFQVLATKTYLSRFWFLETAAVDILAPKV